MKGKILSTAVSVFRDERVNLFAAMLATLSLEKQQRMCEIPNPLAFFVFCISKRTCFKMHSTENRFVIKLKTALCQHVSIFFYLFFSIPKTLAAVNGLK